MSIYDRLKPYGEVLLEGDRLIFFGNRQFQPRLLKDFDFEVCELWQVHGKKVIEAQPRNRLEKADAHWSEKPRQCLLIKTADCIPAFIADDSGQFVGGIHIGWRGLQQKILSESLAAIGEKSWRKSKISLWVGPHIEQDNFCLDYQSTQSLLDAHGIELGQAKNELWVKKTNYKAGHYDVCLSSILYREAKALGIAKVHFTKPNTFTSLNHYSFRRYRYSGGRQYSFIVKL